jgi:hypothetical protein
MAILLRNHKGMPLTAQEMDHNMAELDQRLKRLEDLSMAETRITIEHQAGLLVFKNGLNEELGQVELPRWMPRARGEWQAGEVYSFGDWVRFDGKLYFCKTPHVAPFVASQAATCELAQTTVAGTCGFEFRHWELLMG